MTAPLVEANGAAIPALGLGTWEATDDSCIAAVQWAIEAGYRHIDTAARYGVSRSPVQAKRSLLWALQQIVLKRIHEVIRSKTEICAGEPESH